MIAFGYLPKAELYQSCQTDFMKVKNEYEKVNYEILETGIDTIGKYAEYFQEMDQRYRESRGTRDQDVVMFDSMSKFHREAVMSLTNSQYEEKWIQDHGICASKSFRKTFDAVGGCPYIGNQNFCSWVLSMFSFSNKKKRAGGANFQHQKIVCL